MSGRLYHLYEFINDRLLFMIDIAFNDRSLLLIDFALGTDSLLSSIVKSISDRLLSPITKSNIVRLQLNILHIFYELDLKFAIFTDCFALCHIGLYFKFSSDYEKRIVVLNLLVIGMRISFVFINGPMWPLDRWKLFPMSK